MKKFKNIMKRIQKSSTLTALALAVIAVAEVSTQACMIFIWGQEDMPEELL